VKNGQRNGLGKNGHLSRSGTRARQSGGARLEEPDAFHIPTLARQEVHAETMPRRARRVRWHPQVAKTAVRNRSDWAPDPRGVLGTVGSTGELPVPSPRASEKGTTEPLVDQLAIPSSRAS
jgi:hypothetical protein